MTTFQAINLIVSHLNFTGEKVKRLTVARQSSLAMKSSKQILTCGFKFLKFTGTFVLLFIFTFWGFEAVQKFMSKPISSNVAFKFGDDNKGNFTLPAVTICIDNYKDFVRYRINSVGKCEYLASHGSFYDLLAKCLTLGSPDDPTTTTSATTTEDYSYFGGFFPTTETTIVTFDTMKEYLETIHLGINETMKFFNYGSAIVMSFGGYSHNERIEALKELWIPTFDMELGQCYTFDPYKTNLTLITESEMSIYFIHYAIDTYYSKPPRYYVVIHDRFEDRFDAHIRNPSFIVYNGTKYDLKISKTIMENLNRENEPCYEEEFYGYEKCKYLKGSEKFIEKYNCTLPWMSTYEFGYHTSCESNSVPFMDLYDLIEESKKLYKNVECAKYLPCKRSIYEDLLQQEPTAVGAEMKSKLTIRYSSPYIQVIKDSWSYDMQSFIGEVGGTLGLLLGLSFASVFDLLEHLLNSL